jgi:RNA polymerase sigma factor (sigma-70 family)
MTRTAFAALRRTLDPHDPPDAELMRSFFERRDRDAFELLVTRHGPTVLGVCRRILGNTPDADDAFQAVFLVFLRKAAALASPERIGGWLFAVAVRTATDARRIRARRAGREFPLTDQFTAAHANPDAREIATIVDDELARLSEPIRTAMVQCELNGLSRTQAANRLGIPEGTLSSRLAAGRKALAAKLARRGLAPAALAATGSHVRAEITHTLVEQTLRLVFEGPISPSILLLAKGSNMTLVKITGFAAAAAGLLAVVSIGNSQAHSPTPVHFAPIVQAFTPIVAAGPTVKDAPPVVLKTIPPAGADDIDADTVKELKVTFSKEMKDKSWSWATDSGYGEVPESNGEVAYEKDKKTCVMPVKLKPGTTYAIWINSDRFANFKDADGKPSVPYLLVFQTKKK